MLYNECLESIFIEISFDENKKKYCWSYLPASPYASFTKTASKQYHFKVFRSNDFLFFFCSLYSATYTCCWFTRNTYRQYIHEFCCNSLSLRISGYLTDQNLNKYSNVIIHFLIKMNLKVKLIKWIGNSYLTVMI